MLLTCNIIRVVSKILYKSDDLNIKVSLNDIIKTTDTSRKIIKDSKNVFGTGVTLTNNEVKDIKKLIKSLENRGTLLKGTTRKITSQEGGFLNFLKLLMTAGLPLMKSALTPLFQSVMLPFGLSVGMAAIQKKKFGSSTVVLIISKEEMEDIMKIVKSLEESKLFIEEISETIKNKAKEQKEAFIGMLLGTLVANLLGNALSGWGVIRAGEGTIRAGKSF